VALQWQAPGEARLSREAGKLLLNLLLTGAEALPRGGTLRVTVAGGEVVIEAEGQGAKLSAEAARALGQDGETAELPAKVAPARLARRLAQGLGNELAVEAADSRLRLRCRIAG
jgi:histidine phosphotransferase ChpT